MFLLNNKSSTKKWQLHLPIVTHFYQCNIYPAIGKIILMDQNISRKTETKPDKSDLDDYEKAFSK